MFVFRAVDRLSSHCSWFFAPPKMKAEIELQQLQREENGSAMTTRGQVRMVTQGWIIGIVLGWAAGFLLGCVFSPVLGFMLVRRAYSTIVYWTRNVTEAESQSRNKKLLVILSWRELSRATSTVNTKKMTVRG